MIQSTPNPQTYFDQYYGVAKLTLRHDGDDWDYELALNSPAAPAGTRASYGDVGSGRLSRPRRGGD